MKSRADFGREVDGKKESEATAGICVTDLRLWKPLLASLPVEKHHPSIQVSSMALSRRYEHSSGLPPLGLSPALPQACCETLDKRLKSSDSQKPQL